MRHRVKGYHLGRTSKQREALFKGLIRSLLLHGTIVTTHVKAKAVQGSVDKLITRAKKGTHPQRRLLGTLLPQRNLVNTLVDKISPALKDRNSGYTRMTKLGNRQGDDSLMVKLEIINYPADASKQIKVNPKEQTNSKTSLSAGSEPKKLVEGKKNKSLSEEKPAKKKPMGKKKETK